MAISRNALIITVLILLPSCLVMNPTMANPLRAPKPEDNKVYLYCSQQMSYLFHQFVDARDRLPKAVSSRISRLIMSAEIDSQFKKYPSCLNKLERARFYLQQAGLESELLPLTMNKGQHLDSN